MIKKHIGHIEFSMLSTATDTIDSLVSEGYVVKISPIYSEDLDCEGYDLYYVLHKDRKADK